MNQIQHPVSLILILALILILTLYSMCAYAAPNGPNNPALTGLNSTVGTTGWINTNYAKVSDNFRASVSLEPGEVAHYLTVSDFGFNLDTNTLIYGIEIEVERSKSAGPIKDYSVRIIKDGIISGVDKASITGWSATDQTFTYGGPADLWGLVLTPQNINNASFGFALSARCDTSNGPTRIAYIDQVTMTIHHSGGSLPITLHSLSARSNESSITLEWSSSAELNNALYTVERSFGDSDFVGVHTTPGAGTSNRLNKH